MPHIIKQDLTCHTPTQALAIKISRMTKGSTKAVTESSSSSKKASIYKIKGKLFT